MPVYTIGRGEFKEKIDAINSLPLLKKSICYTPDEVYKLVTACVLECSATQTTNDKNLLTHISKLIRVEYRTYPNTMMESLSKYSKNTKESKLYRGLSPLILITYRVPLEYLPVLIADWPTYEIIFRWRFDIGR